MDGDKEKAGKPNEYIERDDLSSRLIDTDGLSFLFNVSAARVGQIAKELDIPRVQGKYFKLANAIQTFTAFQRSRMRAPAEKGGKSEKDRKTFLEAELLEIKLAESRGELVPIHQVEREWRKIVTAVKTKLLALPLKATPFIAPVTDQAIVNEILGKFLREILNELADGGEERKKPAKRKRSQVPKVDEPGEGSISAATAAESIGLGGQVPETIPGSVG